MSLEASGQEGVVAADRAAAADMAALEPPVDANFENRWAELENEAAAVEAMRVAMEAEVAKLRQLQEEKTPSSDKVEGAVDSKTSIEAQALQRELAAAQQRCEELLRERDTEKARVEKLSDQLQHQSKELSRLNTERFKCLHEKNIAESKLLPIQAALAQSQVEKQGVERFSDGVRAKLTEAEAQMSKLQREKSAIQRDSALQVETLQADIALHKRVAESAREAEEAARRQMASAQDRLLEKTKTFAAERADLEGQLALRSEELAREQELREGAQQQLADALRERDVGKKSSQAAEKEAEVLRDEASTLRAKLAKLECENEELLLERIPGFDPSVLPEGISSVAGLLQEAAAAREEAAQERHAKEQVQELLKDVEREVRVRFQALIARSNEAERLHQMANELIQENEELLKRVDRLKTSKHAAEKQAQKAESSNHILETHMNALAKQLAVLVHENHKLGGRAPVQPLAASEMQALESDRSFFRSVEELTRQNVALRKSVARLTSEGQRPLPSQAARQDEEMEVPKESENDRQQDPAPEVTRPEPTRASMTEVAQQPTAEPEVPLLADLAAVREDFTKSLDAHKAEIDELHTAELKVRQELSRVQRQLDQEVSSKAALQEKLERAESSLRDREARPGGKAALLKTGQAEVHAASSKESLALEQALREKEHFVMQAELARQRVASLEQSNAQLTADKASQSQLLHDLEARVEQGSKCYREARQELEKSFQSKETLWQQQLELYKASVGELRATSTSNIAEATKSREQVNALESTITELRAQLAQQSEKNCQLQAAGSAKVPQSAADSDAQTALEASLSAKELAAKVGKLQEQLRHTEEKMQTHSKNAQLWESLVRAHEADLKARREESQSLEQQLAAAKQQQAEQQQEAEAVRTRELELEARLRELGTEVEGLRGDLRARDDKISAVRQEGEDRARESTERLEAIERERSDSRGVAKQWEQSFQEEATAHAKDLEELSEARGRCASLERSLDQLRRQCHALTADREQVHADRDEEMQNLRQRLERAEGRAAGLAEEALGYQRQLLALSEARAQEDGGAEVLLQIASEMRSAAHTGELRRHELELSLSSREGEAAALRSEAAELRRRLDGERRALQALQEQFSQQERESMKLCQLEHLMCEKRQQAARILEIEAREEQLRKDLDAEKGKVAPLQEQVSGLLQKEEGAAKARTVLEAKADEWKRLHDEVVLKLDTHDINELKKLREDSSKWQVQRTDLQARLEKLQEELRQRAQELQASRALKEKHEELQKQVGEMTGRIDQLTRAKAQLMESNHKKDSHCKQLDLLKTLRDKKIEELERDIKRAHEERQKQQAAAERAVVQGRGEEEARQAQQRADRVLSVAMDYQRALEALLAQGHGHEEREEPRAEALRTTTSADHFPGLPDAQRTAERSEDPEERDRTTREARTLVEHEAREPGQAEAGDREESGRAGSADAAIGATAAGIFASALPPAAAQTQSAGADGAAGVKRKASGEATGGLGTVASVCSPSAAEGEARPSKATRATAPGDGAGGAAAAPGAPAEAAPGAQSGRRGSTAVKAGALAVQAGLFGTSACASSSAGGGTRTAAVSAATVARGVGMVVDLEEAEPESAPA